MFYISFRLLHLLQYFDTVVRVFLPVKTVGRITYVVLVQTCVTFDVEYLGNR